jgi:hypothetical protein
MKLTLLLTLAVVFPANNLPPLNRQIVNVRMRIGRVWLEEARL